MHIKSFIQVCTSCYDRWKRAINASAPHNSPVTTHAAKRPRSDPTPSPETTATARHPICPLCLGILDGCTEFSVDLTPGALTEETLKLQSEGKIPLPPPQKFATFSSFSQALEALKSGWHFDSFALEVSLPAAYAVRHQACWWAAQDAVHAVDLPGASTDIRDVREAVRSIYGAQIKQILGIEPDQTSLMRITVGCILPSEISSEADWVAPPPQKLSRKQRFLQNKQKGEGNTTENSENPHQMNPKPPQQKSVLASPAIISKLATIPRSEFFKNCPASALNLTQMDSFPILMLTPHRKPQYIGGRYLKLVRGLPQSPWIMDGERRGESSVEEEIAHVVLPSLCVDGYSFISSGREDIDVRMLGNGRPFALEVRNARAELPGIAVGEALANVIAARGQGVEVRGLQGIPNESVAILKQGEQEKRKSYLAVCWIPQPVTVEIVEKLNSIGKNEIEIDQWTPVRVLHRRANICRRRAVHAMAAEVIPGRPAGYFLLRLTTAAGTYVKEFVHGDRGRTTPSIKEILGVDSAECVYLDVTGVELEFL